MTTETSSVDQDATTQNEATNDLKRTIPLMTSPDYKKRFVGEYLQLKIRLARLQDLNTRIQVALAYKDQTNVAMPEVDCPTAMLRQQERIMSEYLHILEMRALVENINLPKC